MELNKLETTFFNDVLNAELDVPVPATLKYEGTTFEILVVPEIDSTGYFRLKYYNARSYEPETQVTYDGAFYQVFTFDAALGSHPLLKEAWQKRATVELQLHPSPLPIQPKANPTLKAKVLYADVGHRGELILDQNQVLLSTAPLRKAEFSIPNFCDFVTAGGTLESIAGISQTDQQTLQSIADKLDDGAKLTIHPSPRRVVLRTGDGWMITLTKDESTARNMVSHTGVIEKNNGNKFRVDELNDVIEGLHYFFAFTMVEYCFPSVIIGHDHGGRIAWGKAGKFRSDRQQPVNWFQHTGDVPSGGVLEETFTKFWTKWKLHRDELIAIIDCYVSGEAMRRSGILRDSVAKSCAGLEILAGLVLGQAIRGNAKDKIDKVLRCYQIPYRHLDSSTNFVTHKLCSDLNIADNRGASLIVDVRNYIMHPLDQNTIVKPNYLKYLDGDMVQYVHLHNLCQFYLEYVLLRFCGVIVSNYRRLLEQQHR